MSGEETPQDAHVDQVSSKLTEGLKTCRAMVSHYRTMLMPDHSGNTFKRESDGGNFCTSEKLPPNDE